MGKIIENTDKKQLLDLLQGTIKLIEKAEEIRYDFDYEAGIEDAGVDKSGYLIKKWDGTKHLKLDLHLLFKGEKDA